MKEPTPTERAYEADRRAIVALNEDSPNTARAILFKEAKQLATELEQAQKREKKLRWFADRMGAFIRRQSAVGGTVEE